MTRLDVFYRHGEAMPSRHDPDCSTRDGSALASVRVSGVLALEIAKSGWATQDRAGTAGSHPPHEQGESALGRAPDPWRTSQTRVRKLAQSTVSKYMVRGRTPPAQSWKTFLRNQADGIAAIDLCVVPTLTFERLFAFGVLGHARRRLLWFAVTRQPTAEWLAQQITEAFPWDSAPAYLVRDNDGAYGEVFRRRVRSMGIRDRPGHGRGSQSSDPDPPLPPRGEVKLRSALTCDCPAAHPGPLSL